MAQSSSGLAETYTNRSPELDFVIAKHESPTVRLPQRLPSRPRGVLNQVEYIDGVDPEDEGVYDRIFVKTLSINNVRKNTKHIKDESRIATM
jgi:hypothetical protein